MRIIDRYLLWQFIRTFVICWVSLTGLYVVFDAFTNLQEFIRCGDESGGLWHLLGTFYAGQAIVFFDRTAGLLTLASAMFTVAWIQRHNEMTALMSAGIPRIRIVRPVIAASVVICLLATVNRELIIPSFRQQLSRRPQDLVGDVAQQLQPQYDNQTDVLIRGKRTYAKWKRIERPSFLLPAALNHYAKQMAARTAEYRPPQGDRPGGYLLRDVRQPANIATRPSLYLRGNPVVITPRDAPDWLKPDQCFVVSDVNFEQLTGGRVFRQFSSTAQMISALRNRSLDFGADMRVAIHSRITQPFLDLTLLFLGWRRVASRESRTVFTAIGLCVAVVTVFVLVAVGLQHLGSIYLLDPALAAWAPLMIFIPLAVALFESMRR